MTSSARSIAAVSQGLPPRRWWPWLVGVSSGLAVIALLLSVVSVREEERQVDFVTGSQRQRTVWLHSIKSDWSVQAESSLENELRRRGLQWMPAWRGGGGTGFDVLGNWTWIACGGGGPVSSMTPTGMVFVHAATDAELREFVRVMESGTEAEQRVAVDEASRKGAQAQLSLCARSIDASAESVLQPSEEPPAFMTGRYRATSVDNDATFEFAIAGHDVVGGARSRSRRGRRVIDDLRGGSVDGSRLLLRVGLPVGSGHAKPERVVRVYFQAVNETPRGYEALMAMDSEDYWFDNRADRYIVARLTGDPLD